MMRIATKRKNESGRLGGKVFSLTNRIILTVLAITMLYPFINVLLMSFASDRATVAGQFFGGIPREFSLNAYKRVFDSDYILSGYLVTIQRTFIGTPLTMLVTICMAYPLSKKYFSNRRFWTMVIVFTMVFNGGLIPNYLLVRRLGLIDSLFALILPRLVNTFNMIIVRNNFMTIPESLEESARIEGAGDTRILFSIVLPLSMPIIATLALWTAVGHWNAWFDSLIYTIDTKRLVLQVVLRRIIIEGTSEMVNNDTLIGTATVSNPDSVKGASIVITTMPILMLYPFVQKYFIKGVMVGSIKG